MHYNWCVHQESKYYQREMQQQAAQQQMAAAAAQKPVRFYHKLLASLGQQMVNVGQHLQAEHQVPAQLQIEA